MATSARQTRSAAPTMMPPYPVRRLRRPSSIVLVGIVTCFAVIVACLATATPPARADLIVAPTPSNPVTPPVFTPVPSATSATNQAGDPTGHRGPIVLAFAVVGAVAAGSLVGLRRLRRAGPEETPDGQASAKDQPNGDTGHDT